MYDPLRADDFGFYMGLNLSQAKVKGIVFGAVEIFASVKSTVSSSVPFSLSTSVACTVLSVSVILAQPEEWIERTRRGVSCRSREQNKTKKGEFEN
jgi:hypothetical protein